MSIPDAVLHIPHASVVIPEDVRRPIVLSDGALELELIHMTDRYTDELFAIDAELASSVVYPVSRLVVDPERILDDAQEPMSTRGMGAVYTRTSQGDVLREAPSAGERQALLARFYHPHLAALTRAVDAALEVHDRCLVIDCHSFPAVPLPYVMHQAQERADICLGTDAFHTPAALLERARRLFEEVGYTVSVDTPFSGALVPSVHYRSDQRVSALMVEVNRR